MSGRAAVDALHRCTLHGERPAHPERLMPFRPLDPTNRPSPFKTYQGLEGVPLPRQLRRSSLAAIEVLCGAAAAPAPLDEALLGTLLFLANGVTRAAPGFDGQPIWFRSAMSAGNLHPVELYVVGGGVHHYDPLHHALVPLRPGPPLSQGSAMVVLTGIAFRTGWKYGERGWRHLWWDAGALLANLLATAAAHGVAAQVAVGFPDALVAALVGVDGVDEAPLALVHLGDAAPSLPEPGQVGPLTAQAAPISPRPLRFPLVVEAQAATALDAEEVARWRAAAAAVSRPAPPTVPPPGEHGGRAEGDRVEDVILRRGSTRLFLRRPGPTALLDWGLGAAARAVPLDAAPAGTLLEHLVSVHDVAGHPPGAYRYTSDGGFEGRAPVEDPRAAGRRLCLDQPLGGDAAFTAFHAAALDPLLDALGGRGYRAAQLEAGTVAGRLALNAVALGGGATGLTFYDGLVSRFFDTDAAPMLATAVGIPATRPAPSGIPGKPAELRGYGQVMARLGASLRQRP